MTEKVVWVRADRARDRDERKRIVTTALENALLKIVVLEEDLESFRKLGRFDPFMLQEDGTIKGVANGKFLSIRSKEDELKVAALAGKVDVVVVLVEDWKVIPLENLVAAFQGSGTILLAQVSDRSEVGTFLGALEHGVDGIVFDPGAPSDVKELATLLEGSRTETLSLTDARVTEVRKLGMGDRVCIDTCSMLNVGEGMLIGSSSSGLFLVHSESIGSEYVNTRPFRINAGPVQSYVLGPADRTPYLSDLRVGDELLAVDERGNTRKVVVGRLKIERRPLVLVGAELDGKEAGIILQNAETVRLLTDHGPVSIVDLREGDKVKVYTSEGGRHFGGRIREHIIER